MSALSGLSYMLVAQAVSLSPSSPVDRGRDPRIGLASLPHGHVRAHSEGKPEGGLYHQQLQQDYLHVQQTSSRHLKLTVVVSVNCLYSHVICH